MPDQRRTSRPRRRATSMQLAMRTSVAAALLLAAATLLHAALTSQRLGDVQPAPARTAPPPSRVEIQRVAGGFELLRNGQPMVIKGVGYANVVPIADAPARAQKWREDLRLIAASGFNTLVGWVDREHTLPWTRELLDLAHESGLSVIVPFYLPPDADYTDPATLAWLRAAVSEWVQQHRDHPALLMWGLGNETFREIGADAERAEALAAAYWQLADLVHELDPYHPVTYRAAEERYIGPLQAAYDSSRRERPWFALGLNVYDSTLPPEHFASVLYERWPQRSWDVAAYVAEFNAPYLSGEARAEALVQMWGLIRREPTRFLGGAIYVWSTAGPERTDPLYGLVDASNRPIDQSLERLRAELTAEP